MEFVRDLRARGLARSTIRDYESIFRQMLRFAKERGRTEIGDVDQALLREWRATWTCMASTHQLRITKLKSFFRFAADASWIEKSPAAQLRAPREHIEPTMPLSRVEMRLLFNAAMPYAKEWALLMLMRYSGLAIRDAATLEQGAIDGSLLTLRRAKSNELVQCSLPDPVLAGLKAVADPRREHFLGQASPAGNGGKVLEVSTPTDCAAGGREGLQDASPQGHVRSRAAAGGCFDRGRQRIAGTSKHTGNGTALCPLE